MQKQTALSNFLPYGGTEDEDEDLIDNGWRRRRKFSKTDFLSNPVSDLFPYCETWYCSENERLKWHIWKAVAKNKSLTPHCMAGIFEAQEKRGEVTRTHSVRSIKILVLKVARSSRIRRQDGCGII